MVVGTRSAVFAPLARLGLVIVDEEHDASYKQEEAPRYHGRDVAIVRGQPRAARWSCSARRRRRWRRYQQRGDREVRALIALERRVLDRPLAAVRVVNMRDEYAERGAGRGHQPGARRRHRGAAIAAREQVLVLLNRRGYATAVFCRQCGDTLRVSRTAASR